MFLCIRSDSEEGGAALRIDLIADLQKTLELKDSEIQQLKLRLASYEILLKGQALPCPVSSECPVSSKWSIPQEEEQHSESQQRLQYDLQSLSGERPRHLPLEGCHQERRTVTKPASVELSAQDGICGEAAVPLPSPSQPWPRQLPEGTCAVDASTASQAAPLLSPDHLVTSSVSIGEYHAINSTTLPLLSAAHKSRCRVVSRPTGSQPGQTPSTAKSGPTGSIHAEGAPASSSSAPQHEVNTASIRRRYTALEKGPGSKPDLLFQNPDLFFQSTVVLEYEEDSPSFRRKLQALDENVEGMRKHLQRLVDIVQKYIEAGVAFSAVGRTFASELMHLQEGKASGKSGTGGGSGNGGGNGGLSQQGGGESWFSRLGDLAPALVRFGETIDEIQSYNDAVLFSLESTFLAPMREFVKRELKEVKSLKDAVGRAYEDYVAHLQRHLQQLRRGTNPEVLRARTQDLIGVRRRYELGRIDLVNTLNQLETKKKFQLVERVLCALYAYLGYFHQGHEALAAIEPSMRDLQCQLSLSRRQFSKRARITDAKRMQLEILLSASMASVPKIKAQLAMDDWIPFHEAATGVARPEPGRPLVFSTAEADKQIQSGAHERIDKAEGGADTYPRTDQPPNHIYDDLPSSPLDLCTSSSSSLSLSPPSCPSPPGEPSVPPFPSTPMKDHPREVPVHDGQPSLDSLTPGSCAAATIDGGLWSSDARGGAHCSFSCLKQGYLWKRSNNVRKDWKRRFFYIRNGKLSYQCEDDPIGPPRAEICDLLISTVRECSRDTDTRFTFEILSPGKRPYMLQAESEMEFQEWIKALRSSTESLLVTGAGGDRNASYTSLSSAESGTSAAGSTTESYSTFAGPMDAGRAAILSQATASFVARVREANPVCADCQRPEPDWASVSFGTVMCIECSGIHRSLGVHVSKVRSLLLDAWPRSLREVMEAMGNLRANQVWEARVPCDLEKPGVEAPREVREAWIRDKYVRKAFLGPSRRTEKEADGVKGQEEPNAVLYAAAIQGDLAKMGWALAHGADVNFANGKERRRTPVHAVCQRGQSLAALEFLVLNGGAVDVVDDDDWSPLDLAMNGVPVAGGGACGIGGAESSEAEGARRQLQLQQQNQLSITSSTAMPLVSYLLSKLELKGS